MGAGSGVGWDGPRSAELALVAGSGGSDHALVEADEECARAGEALTAAEGERRAGGSVVGSDGDHDDKSGPARWRQSQACHEDHEDDNDEADGDAR